MVGETGICRLATASEGSSFAAFASKSAEQKVAGNFILLEDRLGFAGVSPEEPSGLGGIRAGLFSCVCQSPRRRDVSIKICPCIRLSCVYVYPHGRVPVRHFS